MLVHTAIMIMAGLIGSATATAAVEPDLIRAFRTLRDRSATRDAKEGASRMLRANARNNPLVCLALAHRLASLAPSPGEFDEAEAAFESPDGYCRDRLTEIIALSRGPGQDAWRLFRFLEKEDFVRGRADFESILRSGPPEEGALLAARAAHAGAEEMLLVIAHLAATQGRAGDCVVWSNHSDGDRWSRIIAEAMMALGAADHLDVPDVREGLAICSRNLRGELYDERDPSRLEDRQATINRIETILKKAKGEGRH